MCSSPASFKLATPRTIKVTLIWFIIHLINIIYKLFFYISNSSSFLLINFIAGSETVKFILKLPECHNSWVTAWFRCTGIIKWDESPEGKFLRSSMDTCYKNIFIFLAYIISKFIWIEVLVQLVLLKRQFSMKRLASEIRNPEGEVNSNILVASIFEVAKLPIMITIDVHENRDGLICSPRYQCERQTKISTHSTILSLGSLINNFHLYTNSLLNIIFNIYKKMLPQSHLIRCPIAFQLDNQVERQN